MRPSASRRLEPDDVVAGGRSRPLAEDRCGDQEHGKDEPEPPGLAREPLTRLVARASGQDPRRQQSGGPSSHDRDQDHPARRGAGDLKVRQRPLEGHHGCDSGKKHDDTYPVVPLERLGGLRRGNCLRCHGTTSDTAGWGPLLAAETWPWSDGSGCYSRRWGDSDRGARRRRRRSRRGVTTDSRGRRFPDLERLNGCLRAEVEGDDPLPRLNQLRAMSAGSAWVNATGKSRSPRNTTEMAAAIPARSVPVALANPVRNISAVSPSPRVSHSCGWPNTSARSFRGDRLPLHSSDDDLPVGGKVRPED